MNESATLLGALLLGLMGGIHCIGMCGGISSAFGLSVNNGRYQKLLAYNFGRISSYTLMGGLSGLVMGWMQAQWLPAATVLRVTANLLLIVMGLYLANWWLGLARIEAIGHKVWKHIQPWGRQLLPVERVSQAMALGMLWGWLPCGLIYTTLLWTATAANWLDSASLMLAFGLGTLPAMLATGLFAQQLRSHLQRRAVRTVAGLMIIAFGVYGVVTVVGHSSSAHSGHVGQHQH